MIAFMFSVGWQLVVLVIILGVIHKVAWTFIDLIRMILYYRFGFKKIFTIEELLDYNMIERVNIPDKKEGVDLEVMSHKEYWNMEAGFNMELKQLSSKPDEVFFQGRIKRRR